MADRTTNEDGTFIMKQNDWSEDQVKAMLGRSPMHKKLCRWISIGDGKWAAVKMNWVTFLLATILTWGFAIWSASDPSAGGYFGTGKSWVSQNFTWLYLGTQDVWCAFLVYLCFSRFGNIRLGKDNERPKYNDFSWFCMLFTCGVAVGLYVFGVSEPLYFYRQPTLWHSWAYDYTITKTTIGNDAQRAQQAIFQTVYHWGIHGWVPYILLAINIGIVCYRYNMPMTIRSCFVPLIGDNALGVIGDMIDALSIATTTFGVCTSLALGVGQIAYGMQQITDFSCDLKANCASAGGTWDIQTYGANSCIGATSEVPTCHVLYPTADDEMSAKYLIIVIITCLATLSVISGLDNGIVILAKAAFTFGTVVMMTIMFNDNTWYLLNVMVQTFGYYLQYIVQVGFDCEAFQQLGYEFGGGSAGNQFWGSQGANSVSGKLAAAGFGAGINSAGADCGDQPNPCAKGFIHMSLASAIYYASKSDASPGAATLGAAASRALKSMNMSPRSIEATGEAVKTMMDVYGAKIAGGFGVPCGGGWDGAVFDGTTRNIFGSPATEGTDLCAGAADKDKCTVFWGGGVAPKPNPIPKCPETVVTDTAQWGVCEANLISCSKQRAYYDDTNPDFMDWWTIFYWAWWITWAPFVGFFVALISRGRTVREVIVGGFVCPTMYAFVWFSVMGGLAIKMQRVAEVALDVKPDINHAHVNCAEHYAGTTPITPQSKMLAEAGYTMLACVLPKDKQIYALMDAYGGLTNFLKFFLWVGLVIYFITSSDSGSMTDDIISAAGLGVNKIPNWQKVFWCWTEGVVAIMLLSNGTNASKALQALSIIFGLPYTILLCLMVPATYRALKHVAGDKDIISSYRFNTQICDIFELFSPNGGSPCSPGKHFTSLMTGLVAPFVAVRAGLLYVSPERPLNALLYGAFAQFLWSAWFILHICEVAGKGMHSIAWVCFVFLAFIISVVRTDIRRKDKIWGNSLEDFFVGLAAYPFALSQIQMHAETQGQDKKPYFEQIDQIKETMDGLVGDTAQLKEVTTSTA